MSKKAAEISISDFPENVRMRKDMYIYSKEHMVYEIIDNAIDEAAAGYANAIAVAIKDNNTIIVEDNGRGIPVTLFPDQKRCPGLTQVEVAMSTLHAGGKLGKENGYKTDTGGLHGVGASCVNALSNSFSINIKTGGKKYNTLFQKGILIEHTHCIEENLDENDTGTEIQFEFDDEIWEDTPFDIKKIENRIREATYLNPSLLFVFVVNNNGQETMKNFQSKNGLSDFITDLNNNKEALSSIISTNGYIGDNKNGISFALQYTKSYSSLIKAFCNNIENEGGDHISGLKLGILKAINEYVMEYKKNIKDVFESSDVLEGLSAVIAIKHPNPKFDGQSKYKIKMPKLRYKIRDIVCSLIKEYLDANPKEANIIIEKCLSSRTAALAAKKARELSRAKKNLSNSMSVPLDKIALQTCKDPELCEIYIVEGDSAGGSAKQGRNRKFQAVLPTKGKILNVEKHTLKRVLDSEMIKLILISIGVKGNIGEDNLDLSDLKYHKIIIMSDADKQHCPLYQ